MAAAGVSQPWPAIDSAKRRGLTPEQVSAIVSHYLENRDTHRWGPGALWQRVHTAGPGQTPSDGWPTSRATQGGRMAAYQRPQNASDASDASDEPDGLEELEPEELEQLAHRAFAAAGDSTGWTMFQLAGGIGSPEIRRRLAAAVRHLDQAATAATD